MKNKLDGFFNLFKGGIFGSSKQKSLKKNEVKSSSSFKKRAKMKAREETQDTAPVEVEKEKEQLSTSKESETASVSLATQIVVESDVAEEQKQSKLKQSKSTKSIEALTKSGASSSDIHKRKEALKKEIAKIREPLSGSKIMGKTLLEKSIEIQKLSGQKKVKKSETSSLSDTVEDSMNEVPKKEMTVAERAREIWLEEGCPEGRAEIHWLQAEKELMG